MTEDYKIIAKDFIAKTLQGGTQGELELFYGNYYGSGRIYEDYDYNATIKCVKQVVSPKNVGVMWTILALWSNVVQKGRFVILDELNEIVTIIDEYESGADIGCYYGLDMDEKGRLFGIEYLPSEDRVRFIMLNNIAVPKGTTYYADIRRTYNVPTLNSHTPLKNTNGKAFLIKISNVSKYCMVVYNTSNWSGNVYTFEIGEGGATTWKESLVGSGLFALLKPYITYDNNNMFSIRTIGIMPDTADPFILRMNYVENDTTIALTYDTIGTGSNTYISKPTDIIWIDYDNILVPFTNATYDKLILQKMNITTPDDDFTKVYEETFPTNDLNVIFEKSNNYNFMYVLGINDYDHGYNWKESIYHIFDPTFSSNQQSDNIFEKVLNEEEGDPYYEDVKYFLIQNQYNLYNHSIAHIGRDEEQVYVLGVNTYQEIYNENIYNGDPYISLTTVGVDPQQFILKNDSKILYARNIYNKTAYGNIIDSSVIIPNNLLNDVEINNEQLWGSTKLITNNENKVITKNKYEELILNIRNRLNIIDNNDNQNILLEEASAIVNQTLARIRQTAYTDLCIWYAKINYNDNTSENIELSQTRTNNVSTISFEITPEKQVDSIEYISQNNTSYLTITPTLEIGKTYTISQDVRIEN